MDIIIGVIIGVTVNRYITRKDNIMKIEIHTDKLEQALTNALLRLTENINKALGDTNAVEDNPYPETYRKVVRLHKIPVESDSVYTFYIYNHDTPLIFHKINKDFYSLRVYKWECGYYFDHRDFRLYDTYVIHDDEFTCISVTDTRIVLRQVLKGD